MKIATTNWTPPLCSSLVDSVYFLLKDFTWGSVIWGLPRETVTPGLRIGDLLTSKAINPLTLWYDQTVIGRDSF